MAVRVAVASLTSQYKDQIRKDLILKEKVKFTSYGKWQSKPEQKEIQFYVYNEQTKEIHLPYFYACALFKRIFTREYPKVSPFALNYNLRDYQEEVAQTSWTNFQNRGTTFLNVFCSYGKTRMGAYFSAILCQQYGLATLITYPRVLVGKSWLNTFKEHTTAKVYVIGESEGPPDYDTQIFLCMDTRLKELDPWYIAKIGHLIIDEAHMFCTSGHVPGLLTLEPTFITALTATYERDDGFERMLDLLVGPERIIRISKKPFFVFQRPTQFTAEPKMGPRGIIFDDLLYKLSIIELRNVMIMMMVMDNLDRKPLVLTRHVDHASNLTTWLSHYLVPYQRTVTKLAGSTKVFRDAHVFIGTISKTGVGFDEQDALEDWKGLRINLLILTASTKKIEQIAGRVFRASDPVIFDIVDDYKNCHDHWKIRKKWYESRNGQVYMVPGQTVGFTWSKFEPMMKEGLFKTIIEEETKTHDNLTTVHANSVLAKLRNRK